MMLTIVMALSALGNAAASPIPPRPLRRCGWLENPTPGNFWLRDRDGEWELATQGGYEAPGFDTLPDMSTRGTVETNGPHGYSCGCVTMTVDKRTKRATRVFGGRPLALKQCRADRRLPKM